MVRAAGAGAGSNKAHPILCDRDATVTTVYLIPMDRAETLPRTKIRVTVTTESFLVCNLDL